jgi:hypothetical protein
MSITNYKSENEIFKNVHNLMEQISAIQDDRDNHIISGKEYDSKLRTYLYKIIDEFELNDWGSTQGTIFQSVPIPGYMRNRYIEKLSIYGVIFEDELKPELTNYILTELIDLIIKEFDKVVETIAVKYNGTTNDVYESKSDETKEPEMYLRNFIEFHIWVVLYKTIPNIYKLNGHKILNFKLANYKRYIS